MLKFLGRMRIALCVATVAGLFSGCGNPYQMASVRGRVTCNGKPATGGVVIFQPMDAPEKTGRKPGHPGSGSRGTVGEDGTFTLSSVDGKSGAGALVGPHRIFFQPPPTRRLTIPAEERAVMSPEEIKEVEETIRRTPIYPPLPCSTNITPGEVEVKRGDNEFTFTLLPK